MKASATPNSTTASKVDVYGVKSRRRIHQFRKLCAALGFRPSALYSVGMRYMVAVEDSGSGVLYMKESSRHHDRLGWTTHPELFSRRLKGMALQQIRLHLCAPAGRTMVINM